MKAPKVKKVKGYSDGGTLASSDNSYGNIAGGKLTKDANIIERRKPQRVFGTSAGDYLHDTALGFVDWNLQGIGAENAIKDQDYLTKAGTESNRLNSGVGAVSSVVGSAALSYFFPALGQIATTAKSGIKNAVGEDTGLSQSDRDIEAKINSFAPMASSLGSMAGKVAKTKKADIPKIDTTPDPAGQVQPQWQADDLAAAVDKSLLTTIPKLNQPVVNSNENGAVDYSTFDTSKLTPEQQNQYGLLKTSAQKKDFIESLPMGQGGMAEGGAIKGPGTAKSDSIKNAEVEEGGFIVPAENAHVAMMLRAKYLGKKTKIANV